MDREVISQKKIIKLADMFYLLSLTCDGEPVVTSSYEYAGNYEDIVKHKYFSVFETSYSDYVVITVVTRAIVEMYVSETLADRMEYAEVNDE